MTRKISAKRQKDYGIASTGYNIYSNNKQIGYCEVDNLNSVLNGNLKLVCPVPNWQFTFSNDLKKDMGLRQ